MLYLILSIFFSVGLLINFRLFPKYGINTLQAIVFNYPVCFLLGWFLLSEGQEFQLDFSENWTWYCLALGLGFIVTFVLSGVSTQKVGITITSLANNISLVIPVLFSLLVFKSDAIHFQSINYIGLALGLLAVGIATYKPETSETKTKFWQGGGVALAVFLMYGVTNTAINYIQINEIKDGSRVIPVTLVMVLGAAISGLLLFFYRHFIKKERLEPKSLIAAVTLGVPNFLSFYFLILALGYYGSSGAFVYPLYNMGVILLSALAARLFFKENLTKTNLMGLVLAIVAIVFISWNALFV